VTAQLRLLLVAALLAGAPPQASKPAVLGIARVTFYAHDLASSSRFYRSFLGLAEAPDHAFVVNEHQTIALVPERETGSDRLVSIAFRTASARFTTEDPDGHRLEFAPEAAVGQSASPDAVSRDLRHAGVIVGSLGSSLAFYGTLGFHEFWRGSSNGQDLSWVNVQVPDGDDYVEFMLYRDLPAPDKRGSQHHVCLVVPDIEASLATLKTRAPSIGYTRGTEIRVGTNRKRQLNLYDPDGTRIELMEPKTIDGKPAPSSTAPPPRG
jgi:catechol 2,3-dioxygenase-like lactoylglutathione lyase family enzyme